MFLKSLAKPIFGMGPRWDSGWQIVGAAVCALARGAFPVSPASRRAPLRGLAGAEVRRRLRKRDDAGPAVASVSWETTARPGVERRGRHCQTLGLIRAGSSRTSRLKRMGAAASLIEATSLAK